MDKDYEETNLRKKYVRPIKTVTDAESQKNYRNANLTHIFFTHYQSGKRLKKWAHTAHTATKQYGSKTDRGTK